MGRTFGCTTGAAAPERRDQTDAGTGLIKVTGVQGGGKGWLSFPRPTVAEHRLTNVSGPGSTVFLFNIATP